MNNDIQLKSIISRGYFPQELPTVFTTEDFGRNITDILADWKSSGVFKIKSGGKVPSKNKKKKGSYSYIIDPAEVELISMPKRGYERRNIHLTHPIPQALLAYELTTHWKSVQKWLSRGKFTLDDIEISNRFTRSIKGINFEVHFAKKGYIEATSDWLVRTDISRFYPSIYTHSIAWAAYGKDTVKQNLKLYSDSLADRLDALVRACNRNQTVGIPIGPDTSRIIAEVISSRIDSILQTMFSDLSQASVDRLQDDWFIGVKTLERAETVLSSITSVYRDYGLEINGSKTSVDRVILASGSPWISEIGAFLSHRTGPVRGPRLREFLSLGLRLQKEFSNEPVLNYVLSIIENQKIALEDVEAVESFLLKATIVSPRSMDRICRSILNIQHLTKQISRGRIRDRFIELAERNLEQGNTYEVIWLIYTLRGLKTPFTSRKIQDMLATLQSSVLGLIFLDMQAKGIWLGILPKDDWIKQATKERVRTDWLWLLAYEGIRHGWLNDTKNLMTEPFFKPLNDRNIIFYDERRNVLSATTSARRRRRERQKDQIDAERFLQTLRGFASEY